MQRAITIISLPYSLAPKHIKVGNMSTIYCKFRCIGSIYLQGTKILSLTLKNIYMNVGKLFLFANILNLLFLT